MSLPSKNFAVNVNNVFKTLSSIYDNPQTPRIIFLSTKIHQRKHGIEKKLVKSVNPLSLSRLR